MDKLRPTRRFRWSAGILLALAGSAGAAAHDVDFSVLLPDAERVYLVGSFNGWEVSEAALMENANGLWLKTLALEEGTYSYKFKAEGPNVSGDGWWLDWKSSRDSRQKRVAGNSVLTVPDDLETFQARQRGASQTEAGIEIPLFYDRQPDRNAAYSFGGYSYHQMEADPPSDDWTLPAFVGDRPLFAVVEIGDSEFLAALDRKSTNDLFYNRLFVDQNGNRDLTDDPPLDGKAQSYGRENYFDCSFPSVDLEIEWDGRRLPYGIGLRVNGSMPAKNEDDGDRLARFGRRYPNLLVSPRCAYLGEFALDGVGYRIALCDSEANGSFDETASIPEGMRFGNGSLYARGDALYVTAADRVVSSDQSLLGDFLGIGGRLFQVRVDIPNGRLVLQPRTQQTGTLEFPAPMRSLTLLSSSGKESLALVRAGTQAPVPAGRWRLLQYELLKKDEWGDEWMLGARGTEDMRAVAVPENGSAPLPVGEPLAASIAVSDRMSSTSGTNRMVRMSLDVLGQAGERIAEISHCSGTNTQHKLAPRSSNRPEGAAYRIIKPDGELVASGSFEYG